MNTYSGWTSPQPPGDVMRDMRAGLAACIEEHKRGPRPLMITYAEAVVLLRFNPTRRNRRRLVKLTLGVRRFLRRQPHPARIARQNRRVRITFSFWDPPDA